MIGYVEAPRAYWMAQGMARASGVKLARAVVEGVISRGELAALVTRCQGCERSTDCEAWLSDARNAGAPPRFCAIGDDLAGLSPLA